LVWATAVAAIGGSIGLLLGDPSAEWINFAIGAALLACIGVLVWKVTSH